MNILIIEDEPALASALIAVCERLNHTGIACYSGARGLDELAGKKFALVILDIGLPDMSGLNVLEKIQQSSEPPPVLIITAHGNLPNAVAARKLGAAGYLVKPLDLEQLQASIQQLLEVKAPATPVVEDTGTLLIGASPVMQRVFVAIAHASVSDSPVLITGPTGTGKTLAARAVHANSARAGKPFVTLHCAALPEQLLESELFGHEKNAFTGAATMRTGHIERAAGGTLFLDEIGDISPAMQAKLLRVVEERVFTRVGGREDLRVDLRLITATNRNLADDVKAGRFREDLFYRLHVLEIAMPALSERKEDLPVLCSFFLGKLAPGRNLQLTGDAMQILKSYDWPGNVRELRNALEHAVAVCSDRAILPQHLPDKLRSLSSQPSDAARAALDRALERWITAKLRAGATYKEIASELESAALRHLMREFEHKPSVLARVLKMNRATLLKKRRQMSQIK
jgi:DNA-binding NtrC family response regulator